MARMTEILMNEPTLRIAITLVNNTTAQGTNYYTLNYRGRPYVITPRDGQTTIDSASQFLRCHGIRVLGYAYTDNGMVLMLPYNTINRLSRLFQMD